MDITHEPPLQAAPAAGNVIKQQRKEELLADKKETSTHLRIKMAQHT